MIRELSNTFDFYKDLSQTDRQILDTNTVNRKLSKGQLMLGDNGRCGGIPFVLSGNIRLFRTSESGKDLTIYRVGEGEMCVLAAVCSFANLEYDFTAEAQEESILCVLSVEVYNSLLANSIPFREFVFSSLADKLITALNAIELLNFSSIETRLKDYLTMSANQDMVINSTHESIAHDIGSSREVVSRKLKELEKQGLLSLQRGKIKLKK